MPRTALTRYGLLPVAALALMLAGILAARMADAAGRDSDDEYTIDVSESGFTPTFCQLNRRDIVRFRNAGTTARRVIIPAVFAIDPPQFDTGMLRPGEVSENYYLFIAPGHWTFQDAAAPAHTFTVTTPVLVEKWDEICAGNPNPPTATPTRAASPSPSGSPSPSASPAASPSPTPTPQTRCPGRAGCLVAAAVASDH